MHIVKNEAQKTKKQTSQGFFCAQNLFIKRSFALRMRCFFANAKTFFVALR